MFIFHIAHIVTFRTFYTIANLLRSAMVVYSSAIIHGNKHHDLVWIFLLFYFNVLFSWSCIHSFRVG